jgi:hypothetical protein
MKSARQNPTTESVILLSTSCSSSAMASGFSQHCCLLPLLVAYRKEGLLSKTCRPVLVYVLRRLTLLARCNIRSAASRSCEHTHLSVDVEVAPVALDVKQRVGAALIGAPRVGKAAVGQRGVPPQQRPRRLVVLHRRRRAADPAADVARRRRCLCRHAQQATSHHMPDAPLLLMPPLMSRAGGAVSAGSGFQRVCPPGRRASNTPCAVKSGAGRRIRW